MLVQCAVAEAGLGPTYGSVTEKTIGIQFLGVRGYPMTGDSGIYKYVITIFCICIQNQQNAIWAWPKVDGGRTLLNH
jgi:hypothetical protein